MAINSVSLYTLTLILLVLVGISCLIQPFSFAQKDPGIDDSSEGETFDKYEPEIIDIEISPRYPYPTSDVTIAARVIDRYGQIQNATLMYSKDAGKSYENITMRLINGIPSNGTYSGTIPSTASVNQTILYQLYFLDDLGYSFYTDYSYRKPGRESQPIELDTEFSGRIVKIQIPHTIIKDPLRFKEFLIPEGNLVVENNTIIAVSRPSDPESKKPIPITAMIKEHNKLENIGLYYNNETREKNDSNTHNKMVPLKNFTSVNMTKVGAVNPFTILREGFDTVNVDWRDVRDNYSSLSLYRGFLPPFVGDTNIEYYIRSQDIDNQFDKVVFDGFYVSDSYSDSTMEGKILDTYCNEQENIVNLTPNILEFDLENYKSTIALSLQGPLINLSSFYDYFFIYEKGKDDVIYAYYPPLTDDISLEESETKYGGQLGAITFTNDVVEDHLQFPLLLNETILDKSECPGMTKSITNANSTGFDIFSVPVEGNPLMFPFDKYHSNLILGIPYNDIQFNLTKKVGDLSRQGFAYNIDLADMNLSRINKIVDEEEVCRGEFAYDSRIPSSICGGPVGHFSSFTNIESEFIRNHTIAIVIIPLIAIFFLLGAIFIFENSVDNISNRLTLTLGIFALIFTLPEVIDTYRPQTPAPTVADSMLSIIIIATIAFTISSIISSSPVVQKWFPKHHSWIDGSGFAIVSIFVILYFSSYLFDDEMWWLVLLIIFGLGYGLLLRTIGVKVDKPFLIGLFGYKRKKMIND